MKRLIYYSAVIGGWSAFLGWLVSELLLNREGGGGDRLSVALSCALVGGAIGAGLNVVAGLANAQWKQQIKRIVSGLLAGGVGGAIGGFVGDILYSGFQLPRALGWMIMGAGIGVVEGLYERSPAKLRNGLIGGTVGGLIGGFLFDPIVALIDSRTGMSSRATAFVILGMCIGVLIGLVKTIFRKAWLTVLDGYRPGRQLIISEGEVILGRAEYAALPFMAHSDAGLDLEHAKILPKAGGQFALVDNHSQQGTRLNNVPVNREVLLNDGDVIKIGYNSILFSASTRHRPTEEDDTPTAPPRPVEAHAPKPVIAPTPPKTVEAHAPRPVIAPTPVERPVPKPVTPLATPVASATAADPVVVPQGMMMCPICKSLMPKQPNPYCIRCDQDF
jgi:FHA domain